MMSAFSRRDVEDVLPGFNIEDFLKYGYDITDQSSLVSMVWNVNITFIVLVSVFMLLRLYTRARITHQFFVDDVLAILAAICILVSSATAMSATQYGLGKHVWNIPLPFANIVTSIMKCVQLMFVAHI